MVGVVRPLVLGSALLFLVSCGDSKDSPSGRRPSEQECPPVAPASFPLPGTTATERSLDYWLSKYSDVALDEPLLTPEEIADYNHRVGRKATLDPIAQRDLRVLPDAESLQGEVAERLQYMRTRLESGELVTANVEDPQPELQAFTLVPEAPAQLELRVALDAVPLRCGPFAGTLHKSTSDDLDRNACGMAHAQEVLQILGPVQGGFWLARTRYALGFIQPEQHLSPPLPEPVHDHFVVGPRMTTAQPATLFPDRTGAITVPAHTSLPLIRKGRVLVATAQGVFGATAPANLQPTQRALTRRAFLKEAFGHVGDPYGLGGQGGGRDCSRLLLDVFETFDVALPRHSSAQAKAGFRHEAIPEGMPAKERVARFEAANERGIVLLSFPGHIMLYLGLGAQGQPIVLHSLGEYVTPCSADQAPAAQPPPAPSPAQQVSPEGQITAEGQTEPGKSPPPATPPTPPETIFNVRKVVVTDMALGAGSSRRSLLERVTQITVFGSPEPPERRLPAPTAQACQAAPDGQLLASPVHPAAGAEMHLMGFSSQRSEQGKHDLRLTLYSPGGEQLAQTGVQALGGPPFGQRLRFTPQKPGLFMVALTSNKRLQACARIRVGNHAEPARVRQGPGAWPALRSWSPDMERFWSLFVESLFDFPADDETTWNNLHSLLRDERRNLLFNHLGMNEDRRLELQPDCADLPYMLRAYFAWKMRLPFSFHICSRGRAGVPPNCGQQVTNQHEIAIDDPVKAFEYFATRVLRSGVHSASGRTVPEDSRSDFYPVALDRASLQPGTVYADPYGHVMILSKWYPQDPQDASSYGILMASEAQPDGTIGRRRFWEGAFLFEPDTTSVGAGFKHFRPLQQDAATGSIMALPNQALQDNPLGANISLGQYQFDKTGFYDHMDALINPEPLDPLERQNALIDALEESVRRRIESVDNAVQYFASGGSRPIAMPHGHHLFQTTGAWEDFSTPSRDMRLLISIDTVLGFPERVAAHPERFAGAGGKPDVNALKAALQSSLASRTFAYRRSNGVQQPLTLLDVVNRSKALEMAYNPNDCVEIRWGAPQGSEERSSCHERADEEQQARMAQYRAWFAERRRPQPGGE